MDKREEIKLIKLERIRNEEFWEKKNMLILVRIIKKLTSKKMVMNGRQEFHSGWSF